MLTVAYGTALIPYLATKCVERLTKEEHYKFSTAAERVSRNTYVDGIMIGVDNINQALIKMAQAYIFKEEFQKLSYDQQLRKYSELNPKFIYC